MIKEKEMELLYIQMGTNMKGNGKIISNMEKGLSHIAQVEDMMGNGQKENSMDKVLII